MSRGTGEISCGKCLSLRLTIEVLLSTIIITLLVIVLFFFSSFNKR